MRIIAMCNQKGGVGKTTSTRNLLRAGAQDGLRMLGIDADPQGNLTSALAQPDMPTDVAGLADVLSARSSASMSDVIVPTIWPGVDLVPSGGDVLEAVRDELVVAGAGRETRLRDGLASLGERYDVVLIDTRPALDQLTVNALTAATSAVIVTNPELFSANGIAALRRTIEAVTRAYNPQLTIQGVLINHIEGSTTTQSQHWVGELRASGLPILDPAIPRHTWIGSANGQGVALDEISAAGVVVGSIYGGHLRTLMGAGA